MNEPAPFPFVARTLMRRATSFAAPADTAGLPGSGPADTTRDRGHQVVGVQVLRGVAALLVVFRHAWDSFAVGGVGVDVFFVISGFIMVHASAPLCGSAAGSLAFMKRRLLRVAPPYWIAMALYAVVCGAAVTSQFFRSAAFLPSASTPFLPTGWTLNYEIYFYAVFAVCMAAGSRAGPWLAAAVLVGPVLAAPFVAQPVLAYYGQPFVLDFVYGVLLGIAHRSRIRSGLVVAWSLAAAGLAVLATATGLFAEDALQGGLRPLAWGIPAALLVAAAVFGPASVFSRHPVALYLGEISFSLYLVHFSIVHLLPGRPLAIVALSVLAGIGFHTAVERPLHQFARGRSGLWRCAWRRPVRSGPT